MSEKKTIPEKLEKKMKMRMSMISSDQSEEDSRKSMQKNLEKKMKMRMSMISSDQPEEKNVELKHRAEHIDQTT